MDTPRPYIRVGLFVLGLAAVFAVAAAIGAAAGPAEVESEAPHGTGETRAAHTAHEETSQAPAGLGLSDGGYTLRLRPSQMERGRAQELRFAIEGADGAAVTEFDELHERRMHLIVVRRDGAEFRHLHPEMDASGAWSAPVEFDRAGVYRAFADFSVAGEQETLASDVFVSGGEFEARPFPAPRPVFETDGYEVRLDAEDPVAGEPDTLVFSVTRGGHPVDDLGPYLGAKGHLVVLREGDLAFLHVHPEEGHEGEANAISFEATFPTAGRYRLYLQFKHEGVVRTAEFTVVVSR